MLDELGGDAVPPADGEPVPPEGASGTAQPARYAEARRELRKFIKNGNTDNLRDAIGHYTRKGSGGAAAASTRMRASTRAGAELYSFLNAVSQGASAEARQWVQDLQRGNPTADDVVDAIVRELSPPGGSADEEALRDSMASALTELVIENPGIDLMHLQTSDIWELMKSYLASEVAHRLCFDLGPLLESAKVDPVTAVQRERDMRIFIKEEIGAHLDLLRDSKPSPSRSDLDAIFQETLKMTFELFEAGL
ncbi:Qat anti-phage system associated protein QatB [Achromobacter insuavis]|uniref:Qat anti-phage system associated protein QatB n=1 Tax=Achromobacter insuavis TaxID=1287735 RepID=UPI001F14031C|nr:Qat anti-phage system associated protein QatB [Achromobacter insuavis]